MNNIFFLYSVFMIHEEKVLPELLLIIHYTHSMTVTLPSQGRKAILTWSELAEKTK